MFGTSGIRGAVGDVVTTELGVALGTALGRWGATRVVIGRDPRPSGAYLVSAVASGLRQSGVDVVDIGLAATPTIARAVGWRDADAGVAVTASHNPPADNGFKLWLPSGQAFRPDEQAQIESYLEEPVSAAKTAWKTVGSYNRWHGADARHVTELVDSTDVVDPLRVVIDIGNGAGQVTAVALDELGCEVTTINGQPDGGFPGRPSEPTAEHCADLRHIVPVLDADVGLAHDGDADRLRVVDETGHFLTGDMLLTVFAQAAASSGDTVVAPVDTSLAVEDTLAELGVDLVRTRVGDVFVAEAIREHGAVFGGEPSGAWIWPDATLCPDGPLAACRLLELVSTDQSLGQFIEAIEEYPIYRDAVEVVDKPTVMKHVREAVQDQYDDVETIDGVRVTTPDGWFLVRPSGTEPIIRITAEARKKSRAKALLSEATGIVTSAK